MTQDAYTGVHGTVSYAGSTIAVAEFDVKIKRGVASHARSGKWSDYKLPGKIDVTGSMKRILTDGELLAALLNATPATGAAEALHAGLTCPGDGSENITDMTDTSIASASRITLTAIGGPVTGAGTAILIGTDANGNDLTEPVAVTTLAENSYVVSSRTFKTLTHVALKNVAMGVGDTLKVASITGSASVTVGEPKVFNLIGKVDDGSNHVYITMNNCFFTDGEFKFTDADGILEDPLSFTMRDPDADLTIEYVNA